MQAKTQAPNPPGSRKAPPVAGRLFVVSAPSGAGKSTICEALLERIPSLKYSVSYTTRSPRGEEKNGRDYHFVSKAEFLAGIQRNSWAEWAEVHGNYYGTSADVIDGFLRKGNDVLLDIDVQGARQILKRYPDSVTIFIMPPSAEILRERLVRRGTDSPEAIERRLKNAETEMAQKGVYRHVIVNDDLNKAVAAVSAVIVSARTAAEEREWTSG
jgi:guanylate kinase